MNDWRAANDVADLRASVLAGARSTPPKTLVLPGVSVAQRGGAAAESAPEPPSPPAYDPVPRALSRPAAPDLKFGADERSSLVPSGIASGFPDKRTPQRTLIIHSGAPQAEDSHPDAPQSPIVVPSPVAGTPPNTITRPPPVMGALVMSEALSSARPAASPAATPAAGTVTPKPAQVEALSSSALESSHSVASLADYPSNTQIGAPPSSHTGHAHAPETPRVLVPFVSWKAPAASAEAKAAEPAPGSLRQPTLLDVAAAATRTPTPTAAATNPAPTNPAATRANPFRVGSSAEIDAAWGDPKNPSRPPPTTRDKITPPVPSEPLSVGRLQVDSAMMLPSPDSSVELPAISERAPYSSEELSADDLMPASVRHVQAVSNPPPAPKLSMRPPSSPSWIERQAYGQDVADKAAALSTAEAAQEAESKTHAPPKRSRPSDIRTVEPKVVLGSAAPPALPQATTDSAESLFGATMPPTRTRLSSRPPPPDIDPLAIEPAPAPTASESSWRKSSARLTTRVPRMAPDHERQDKAVSQKGVPYTGFVATIVVIGSMAYLAGRMNASTPETAPTPLASTEKSLSSASSGANPTAAAAGSQAGNPAVLPASAHCTITMPARTVASKVTRSGVEAAADSTGFMLGFASATQVATALRLDPISLTPSGTTSLAGAEEVRRTLPSFEGGKLAALAEFDAATRGVVKRRAVYAGGDAMGFENGQFVFLSPSAPNSTKLFAVGLPAPDALRVAAQSGTMAGNGSARAPAFAFRQGNTIWTGLGVNGPPPARITGLGIEVGAPGVIVLGDTVLTMWADRVTADEPWALRQLSFLPGKSDIQAKLFVPPPSLGGARFSPAFVRIDEKTALALWTEGGTRNGETTHEVRAVVMNADGSASGSPFTVSGPTENAGQPQGALQPSGAGIISYLISNGDNYEVAVAGIKCIN